MSRPKLLVKYCITRNGVIQFPSSLKSSNQCVKSGHTEYHYICKVYSDNQSLDKNGFLIDHNDINDTCNKLIKQKLKGSCELISEGIIGLMVKTLNQKKQRFSKIEVELRGKVIDNPAFITAEYTNPNF